MKRKSINPWDWGLAFSMDQGEIIEGASRHLHCSGQVSVRPDEQSEMGISVVSPNEIRGRMEVALGNVDAALGQAGMNRSNVTSLRFFTTDIDIFLTNYDGYAQWIADAGTRPPQSLIGVARLVFPELLVEIEATAAAWCDPARRARDLPVAAAGC